MATRTSRENDAERAARHARARVLIAEWLNGSTPPEPSVEHVVGCTCGEYGPDWRCEPAR